MRLSVPATTLSASGYEEAESVVPAKTEQGPPSRWRRFMRRMLRRPEPPVPPVSMSVEAQFVGETNSTIDMTRYSLYSPELQLIAETSTTAVTPWIANEYVWFNGETEGYGSHLRWLHGVCKLYFSHGLSI